MDKLLRKISAPLAYLFLICNPILVLGPVIWTIMTSSKKGDSLPSSAFNGTKFTFSHYIMLFTDTSYMQWYLNAFILITANILIPLIVVTMTAYVPSRYRFRGERNALISILMLQMLPVLLSMAAIYVLLSKANLTGTYTGLLLIYVTDSSPSVAWLVRDYFGAILTSLDKAAKTDGIEYLTTFIQIILPLAKPILVFAGLVSFTGPWMDLILPTLVFRSEDRITLTIGIFSWIASNSIENHMLFAVGTLPVATPITLLFAFTQKHITAGLVGGAVREQLGISIYDYSQFVKTLSKE